MMQQQMLQQQMMQQQMMQNKSKFLNNSKEYQGNTKIIDIINLGTKILKNKI